MVPTTTPLRPTKRRRRAAPVPYPSSPSSSPTPLPRTAVRTPTRTPSRTQSRTPSRKRSIRTPTLSSKRRLSNPTIPPSNKKARVIIEDVQMAEKPPMSASRRARETPRRQHPKIIPCQLFRDAPPMAASHYKASFSTFEATYESDAASCSSEYAELFEHPVRVVEEEEIDISYTSDLPKEQPTHENSENMVQTRLLDDGTCVVRILRPNGQYDHYVLYPRDDC